MLTACIGGRASSCDISLTTAAQRKHGCCTHATTRALCSHPLWPATHHSLTQATHHSLTQATHNSLTQRAQYKSVAPHLQAALTPARRSSDQSAMLRSLTNSCDGQQRPQIRTPRRRPAAFEERPHEPRPAPRREALRRPESKRGRDFGRQRGAARGGRPGRARPRRHAARPAAGVVEFAKQARRRGRVRIRRQPRP